MKKRKTYIHLINNANASKFILQPEPNRNIQLKNNIEYFNKPLSVNVINLEQN